MRRPCQRILGLALMVVLAAGCGAQGGSVGGGQTPVAGTVRAAAVGHLQAVEARELLSRRTDALVLDVRNPEEWDDDVGHLEGARLIPLAELSGRLAEIDAWRDKPVVVVCRVGGRSAQAARMLVGAGFQEVYNLEGGMVAWRQAEGVGGP